jgi:hypothetical protein
VQAPWQLTEGQRGEHRYEGQPSAEVLCSQLSAKGRSCSGTLLLQGA